MAMASRYLYLFVFLFIFVIPSSMSAWTKVFFRLQGRNLPDKDGDNDYSDPFVKVYISKGGSYECIGRSETIDNSHNPDWKEVFSFDYEVGKYYRVQIEIRDHDVGNADDPIGDAYFTVGQHIPDGRLSLSDGGYVIITPEFFGAIGGGRCTD